MKAYCCMRVVIFLSSLCFHCTAANGKGGNGDRLHQLTEAGSERDITCRIVLIHALHRSNKTGAKGQSSFECDSISNDGHVDGSYSIDLPNGLVETNKQALATGEWYVKISKASFGTTAVKEYGTLATHVRLSPSSKITTISPTEGQAGLLALRRRLSLTSTGKRSIMILRVLVNDAAPTYNASQLVQYFFDPFNYSVTTRFSQCSSGALTFHSYNASNPVSDVYVNASIRRITKDQLYRAATVAAEKKFKIHPNRLANHVAFILPAGTNDPYWFAFGGVNDWRSVYNNTIGGIVNTVVHELGHNIGLSHAGKDGNPYADLTSIMGYGKFRQFGPPKCFSGYNFWSLNWFPNRQLNVTPTNQSQLVQLATFVDYAYTTSTQYVVVKVGNYYLVYNRAKGCNRGTEMEQDKVTIVLGNSSSPSWLVAAITNAPGATTFIASNYNRSPQSLTIAVCEIVTGGVVDYATLGIGLGTVVCPTNRLRGNG